MLIVKMIEEHRLTGTALWTECKKSPVQISIPLWYIFRHALGSEFCTDLKFTLDGLKTAWVTSKKKAFLLSG